MAYFISKADSREATSSVDMGNPIYSLCTLESELNIWAPDTRPNYFISCDLVILSSFSQRDLA